ncbi:MAG: rhodanese-like domain-containing protein [Acidobacteriota bacterium]|nr:rhodanese-like domain-containing protein [Acidobacteriota bacterium]
MRKTLVLALSLSLTGVYAHAQMKNAVPPKSPIVSSAKQTTAGTFQRISQTDAYKLYKEDKAVFIDVRSNAQFALGHIKGSLTIPGSQIIGRYSEVTPGKVVITYCACTAEQSSGAAATNLVNHGVKNVFALKGGWSDWKSNRYPTATGPK